MPRETALVLGCTVGAGGAIARRMLMDRGMDVIGLHRGNHPEAAEALARAADEAGRSLVLIEGDAGRLTNLPELAERVGEALGDRRLDVMLHAIADASIGRVATEHPERDLHPKQVLKTFEVMAHSFLFWTQALVHSGHLRSGSQVLALPNFMDTLVARGFCAIGASKAALNVYVRYLANELGGRGIRVNGLRFGATPTDALQRLPAFRETMDAATAANPMGRHTTLDDVADFAMLLLDPRAHWLNGAIIDLDGGESFSLADLLFGDRR